MSLLRWAAATALLAALAAVYVYGGYAGSDGEVVKALVLLLGIISTVLAILGASPAKKVP